MLLTLFVTKRIQPMIKKPVIFNAMIVILLWKPVILNHVDAILLRNSVILYLADEYWSENQFFLPHGCNIDMKTSFF